MKKTILLKPLLVLALVSQSPLAHAVVIQNSNFSNTSATAFAASNADLINTGSSALAGLPSISGPNTFGTPSSEVAKSTNGVLEGFGTWYNGATNLNPTIVTYQFSLAQNTLGYDLTSIHTIAAYTNGGSYVNQDFDVYISFVGTPTSFQLLQSVAYNPILSNLGNGVSSSSEVTLTDSTGTLATGVAAIQFQFKSNGSAGQIMTETDVFGTPTAVPEPSTYALLFGGAGLVLWLRLRPHRAA